MVTTASGERLRMRALAGTRRGRDFPIVWVCPDEKYTGAETPDLTGGIPWPAEDVELDEEDDQMIA